MPANYRIDVQAKTVFSTSWGTFIDEDLLKHAAELSKDPAFEPTFRQLWDLTDVTSFKVSKKLMIERGSATLFAPGTQRAFVVPDDLAFGMTRLFEAHNQKQHIGVFRTIEVAWDWLWEDD